MAAAFLLLPLTAGLSTGPAAATGNHHTIRIYSSREARRRGEMPVRELAAAHKHTMPLVLPPTASNRNYNESQALEFAYLAQLAYCPPDDIRNLSCASCSQWPGFANLTVITATEATTDAQAYVVYDKRSERIILAFRGSHTLRNWIYNFDFASSAYPLCDDCRVHSGFLKSWKSVQTEVTKAVKGLASAYPKAKLYLVGHSMGASLAALAAVQFVRVENLTVHAAFSFGEPRVGNDNFGAFHDNITGSATWRMTHYKDPVPHLPPIMFGYHHVSTEIFYDQSSESYKMCDHSGEDPTCSDSVASDDLLYISDHLEYLNIRIADPVCS